MPREIALIKESPLITDIHTHTQPICQSHFEKKKPRTTYIYTFSPSVRLPQMSNRWHHEKIFHVGNFYCGAALHCSIVTPTKFLEATTASSHNAPSSFILASSRMMAFYHDNFSSCLQLWCCYVVQGAGAIPTRPPLNINSNSSWM